MLAVNVEGEVVGNGYFIGIFCWVFVLLFGLFFLLDGEGVAGEVLVLIVEVGQVFLLKQSEHVCWVGDQL